MNYHVLRPPLAKDFELPSREELLRLKEGDSVKLIFKAGVDLPERMWVLITACSKEFWEGTIDTDATQEETAKVLPAGTKVNFHPLDIIAVN